MTTIPTPADFLMIREPDEDDAEPFEQNAARLDDLERRLYALEARGRDLQNDAQLLQEETSDQEHRMHTLIEDLADEQAKHAVVIALVDQIEGIVRKSTSQVSLAVKAAIKAWANPDTPSPAPDVAESAVDDAAGAGSPEQDVQQSAGEGLPQPAVDAPVDEWRAYARSIHAVPEGTVLDQMNRSQIRTLLGIEQPVPAAEA